MHQHVNDAIYQCLARWTHANNNQNFVLLHTEYDHEYQTKFRMVQENKCIITIYYTEEQTTPQIAQKKVLLEGFVLVTFFRK
jgi:hypothetical protein